MAPDVRGAAATVLTSLSSDPVCAAAVREHRELQVRLLAAPMPESEYAVSSCHHQHAGGSSSGAFSNFCLYFWLQYKAELSRLVQNAFRPDTLCSQLLPSSTCLWEMHAEEQPSIPSSHPTTLPLSYTCVRAQDNVRSLLSTLRSSVAIPAQVEEAMRMVPRSMFLPPGQAALAWQARPVLPSGHSLILGSPQAEALALQVGLQAPGSYEHGPGIGGSTGCRWALPWPSSCNSGSS